MLRIERKYPLSKAHYQVFQQWLSTSGKKFVKSYPSRQVNNLYFDSPELDCFNENLSGQSVRAKCRLRWYGNTQRSEKYTFEVKRRKNKCGDKLQQSILGESLESINPVRVRNRLRVLLEPDLRPYLDQTPCPILLNRYQRQYFQYDEDVRLTVDTDMAYRLVPANGFSSNGFVSSAVHAVVEIKFPVEQKHIVEKVENIFRYFPLSNARHSKYVVGIQHVLGL